MDFQGTDLDYALKPFGLDAKTPPIEQRRPQKIEQSPGPGEY